VAPNLRQTPLVPQEKHRITEARGAGTPLASSRFLGNREDPTGGPAPLAGSAAPIGSTAHAPRRRGAAEDGELDVDAPVAAVVGWACIASRPGAAQKGPRSSPDLRSAEHQRPQSE